MTAPDRPLPPFAADERDTLAGWLEFQRATLAGKCAGLDERRLRTASVPPSTITLLGLVRHMAEVERNWFRRVLLGEAAPPIFDPDADPDDVDGGFELSDEVDFTRAHGIWQGEIERARANCAGRALDATSPFGGARVTLRWIYLHMIGEYARHNGHADLVRECIDGSTGV
jgi:hypothetical protein